MWLRDKHMLAFSLVDQVNPMRVIDLLLKPDVPFDELLARSQEVTLKHTTVRIASVDDLIALKRHAGRPQDLADIEQLEAIQQRKGNR
jgi:predicted nucleotidyltransferase